ncbi:toll/interleukin-1 receptor domain-containing protein [Rhizobium sp. Rhizsp82]|uniref:toll/interleukin-1 receptor domain-containing protein n=1 Tax=Rhizobium sp. Rhizsp82 TaxID=3243057 RepID=UPI0039B58710
MYLRESTVRKAAQSDVRIVTKSLDAARILKESVETAAANQRFDVFLSHSIRDAEIVLGAKKVLEDRGLTVYVDWIVDPSMDRSYVTAGTAETLRMRMKNSRVLLYLYSQNSRRSRWMPWELGYFDGFRSTVAILPVLPDNGAVDFSGEEYLNLYPKVEIIGRHIYVNRTRGDTIPANDRENWRVFENWAQDPEQLRML